MTQLLISVKNAEEALIALQAGADIIDLKDPNVGALGALAAEETRLIVQAIDGLARLSSTVGEQHVTLNDLVMDIEARAEMGIDIIKIAVSELFYDKGFLLEMAKLSIVNIKIVAVFFADTALDLSLLALLQKAGFYGAMLDTQNKQNNLLEVRTKRTLRLFTQLCHQYHLKSGLAGSLRPQHIELLAKYNPTYIGFRGGVCENLVRNSALTSTKVMEIKNMLHEHNKNKEKPQLILQLALHS
ncbi:MAG: (5-formylfuran-3-yl)methyl phosphate synthase [Methylotenera sp.]